jgi:hypothetical protein
MTTLAARKRLLRRRIRITGWTALSTLVVTIIGFLTWFHIVFPADRAATLDVYQDERVVVTQADGVIIMGPAVDSDLTTGLLFFPGARVDPFAYLHPFVDVAANGTTVIIVDPLFNMALFDQRDLATLTAHAPDLTDWVLAGHSLGGVKACMEADHPAVSGLVLLASYCATDISGVSIQVIEVVATEDGLIDAVARGEAQSNLPADAQTITLENANHASFGTYGPQPGDGIATLSRDDIRQAMNEVWASASGSVLPLSE